MGRALAQTAAGRPMAIPGAAPLIVCAFRRSTSTDAFPDRRRRTRQCAATIRGGTPDMTSGCADEDHAGARPSCTVARERVPEMRRMCTPEARAHPYLRRTAERLGSDHFSRCILTMIWQTLYAELESFAQVIPSPLNPVNKASCRHHPDNKKKRSKVGMTWHYSSRSTAGPFLWIS
jgi:hypothetical protein